MEITLEKIELVKDRTGVSYKLKMLLKQQMEALLTLLLPSKKILM